MDDSVTPNSETIRERFDLGDHVLSTRTSEACEGVDLQSAVEVLFWTLRHPISPNSDGEARFLERMNRVSLLAATPSAMGWIPGVRAFGVDRIGTAYLATNFVGGVPIGIYDTSPELMLRLFEETVASVAIFHREGLSLGDICEESFLVCDDGKVRLVGMMGSFDLEAKRTATLPPASTLPYLAPEQRTGVTGTVKSDIFALGVLGYRILTGRYPFGDRVPVNAASFEELLSAAPAPSTIKRELPAWTDDVLGKCLEIPPENRFLDAADLGDAIRGSREAGYAVAGGGRWARRTVMVKPRTEGTLTQTPLGRPHEFTGSEGEDVTAQVMDDGRSGKITPGASSVPAKFIWIATTGLALGAVVAGSIFLGVKGGSLFGNDKAIQGTEFAPPELQPALTDLRTPGVSLDQKLVALKRLASSENPVSFSFLSLAVKGPQPAEIKTAGFNLISEKIRSQGLVRAGDVVRQWLSAYQTQGADPSNVSAYDSIIRACDVTLPPDGRKEALHKIFAEDRTIALQLAAALSLDDLEPDHFAPVLRQLLTASGTVGDLSGKSVGAMIVSNRMLALFFDREVKGMLSTFTPLDLAWSMTKLAESDSSLLFELAEETIKRSIVPPYQSIFLKLLVESDRFSLPKAVKLALVRSAQGQISSNDVATFAGWLDIHGEPALLAICALSENGQVAIEAFDALTVRAVRSEPAASLIPWIQRSFYEYRSKLVKPVGVLSLSDIATTEEVSWAFDMLMPYSASGSLYTAVVKSNKPRLVEVAIERMGAIITTLDLIKQLDNADRGVKIAVIRALKERNDITDLQRLIRAYERETDEAVRTAYRENLWVIRNRERK